MQQQYAPHGQVQRRVVLLVQRGLHAAQAGRGAAAARVAGGGVVVVQRAARPAAGELAVVEAVEILLMALRVDAQAALLVLVEAPADVVVAAQVVDEPAVFRQRVERIQLRFEQPHVPRGQRRPQIDHDRYVVQHVAFRLFRRAVVGGQFRGAMTTSPLRMTAGQTHSKIMRTMRTMVCTCGRLRQVVPKVFQI